MDEKIFNLLEQMQSNFMSKFDKVQEELKNLKEGQDKILISLENEIKPDIKLSLQGFIDTNEKLASIEDNVKLGTNKQFMDSVKIDFLTGKVEMVAFSLDKTSKSIVEKLDTLSSKIEKHDVEINVIKRVI